MREALREINPTARLHVVRDGVEAMEFLGYQGPYLDAPRPSVILLDLNLPKMQGHEVLARVKANPHLQTIPVIVLTSSEAETNEVKSYEVMANSYLKKTGDLSEFEALVKSLNDFLLTRVKLPKHEQTVGPL
jgi:chemotaxis family two-component system response regulator Rcp1